MALCSYHPKAWEWGHFIHGDSGGVQLNNMEVVHVYKNEKRHTIYDIMDADSHDGQHHHFELDEFIKEFSGNSSLNIRLADRTFLNHSESVTLFHEPSSNTILLGANLKNNEYGHALFADYFFFITGFHGFHVLVVLCYLLFF